MPPTSPLERRLRDRMTALERQGLRRLLAAPQGVDLASNDYLKLARHPYLVERFVDAVQREGCGSSGSRLLTGERDGFDAVERRFAAFKGVERALLFSSGYLANLAVLTTLTEEGDVIFSDERNHASLIDAMRLSRARRVIVPHNDVEALARALDNERGKGTSFVVTESVFSMDGDVAPLVDYAACCRTAGATLIVDEAHAVGLYGVRGSGLIEATGTDKDVCVSINPAGKALGAAGAWVAGPGWAIDYLVQRARSFIFSTAPPPALAGALEASLDLIEREPERRERLAIRSRFLRDALTDAGVPVMGGSSQIVPVIIGGNQETTVVAKSLRDAGYDVRAIRPPSVPAGTARLRISVNCELAPDTLTAFVSRLASTLRETVSCHAASS